MLGGGAWVFEGCDGRICDARSLQSSNCLGCLLNVQLCSGLLIVVKSAEIGGGGCLDDLREARLPAQTASWIIALMRGLAAMRAPRCACAAMSRALLKPIPDWPAGAEGRLCRDVLCETREEPFERPLPDLVVDVCSPLFLQCVAVNPEDVVATADSQTISEEGELRLRVLAELEAFVHRSNDVCLAQELVRDDLPRSNSDSEGDAAIGVCGGLGHVPHVTNSPLGWSCVQIVLVVDDFRFSVGSAALQLSHWRRRVHGVTIVRIPLICQASAFLQRVLRVVGTGELCWAAKLEVCRFLQGRVPAACRAVMLPRVSAATIPQARLHSSGPSTSPCSAPRSFGTGGSPSCST